MRRINTLNKDSDAFGAGKHGWKNGVPGTVNRPTEGQAEWFNSVQEELAGLVEGAGMALDGGNNAQVRSAIAFFAGPGNPSTIKSLPDVGVTAAATAVANTAALTEALSTRRSRLLVPEGDFQVTGDVENKFGAELAPGGRITKPITGGRQQINSYADLHKYVFGREYLAAFHKLLIAQMAAPTLAPKVLLSGDSTTAGDGTDAEYRIHTLLEQFGTNAGLNPPFGMAFTNAGHSGWNTERWRIEALAGEIALAPHLWGIRYGVNDPGFYSADYTAGPALDAGQAAPGRRTATDYLNSLRQALTTIRASCPLGTTSIVLMTPNSTSDTPNARDELWYEQIVPGIKQAARDFNCCFVDVYAFLRDSRKAAGVWMDDPLPGGGRAIHPGNVMNTWIVGLLGEVIFPEGLRSAIGRNNVTSIAGAQDAGDVARAPGAYRYGLTLSRAGQASGFPFDGVLETLRWQDEVVVQRCYPFRAAAAGRYAVRVGRAKVVSGEAIGWEAWVYSSATALSAIAASAGYVQPAAGGLRVARVGDSATIEGYLTKSAPAVIAANSTIGTIAAGFSPQREALVGYYAAGYDGAAWQPIFIQITPTGDIKVLQATTLSIQRVYVAATWNVANLNA